MHAARVQDFRRRMIERIVREDPWIARSVVASGRQAELAPELGLQADILEQAAHMLRRGARSEDGNLDATRFGRYRLRIFLSPESDAKLKEYGNSRKLLKGAVVRVLMHTAMQSKREPSGHGYRVPRSAMEGEAPPRHRNAREVVGRVTCGLYDAIVQRAGAYGVGFNPYTRYWVLDLIEGRLADMEIPIVPFLGLYDDAKSYVLPAFDKAG